MNKIQINEGEIDAIGDELHMFAAYLHNYPVDTMRARTVLDNQARADMIEGSANTVDAFFHALHDGKMDYFLDFQRDNKMTTPDPTYNDYLGTLRRWANDVDRKKTCIVTREEARAVYSYVIKKFDSPAKFKKMGEKYHFEKDRGYVDGKQVWGWVVHWLVEDRERLEAFLEPDVPRLKLV